MTNIPMEILLATDLSARCDRAFDRAMLLSRQWNARLTIVTAIEGPLDHVTELVASHEDMASLIDPERDAVAREIREEAAGTGIPTEVIVRRGKSAEVLIDAVREGAYDLVITGIARRTGFLRSMLGGTAEAVLKQGTSPVLMVKTRVRAEYRVALAGVDFSEGSRAALACARALFPELRPIVLHTFRPGYTGIATGPLEHRSMLESARADCEQFIAEVVPDWGELLCIPQVGDAVDELSRQARRAASDLIIVGSNNRGAVAEFLFGSTGRDLISLAPCDLMIVPASWQAPSGRLPYPLQEQS
jgi:nucleotide-binding universal stress UspA family protein